MTGRPPIGVGDHFAFLFPGLTIQILTAEFGMFPRNRLSLFLMKPCLSSHFRTLTLTGCIPTRHRLKIQAATYIINDNYYVPYLRRGTSLYCIELEAGNCRNMSGVSFRHVQNSVTSKSFEFPNAEFGNLLKWKSMTVTQSSLFD